MEHCDQTVEPGVKVLAGLFRKLKAEKEKIYHGI
jgi:hypothetical protein